MANKIEISGVVGWDLLESGIREQLKAAAGGDLHLEINSPGGLVSEGLAMYRLIKNYAKEHGAKVTAEVIGMAASMGSLLALAGTELPTVSPTSVFMIHQAWGFAMGNSTEMREVADTLESLTNIIAGEYASNTSISKEDISAWLAGSDKWFFGKEIAEAGFATIEEGEEPDETTQGDELALAKLMVEDSLGKFSDAEKKADLMKAAAMFKTKPRGNGDNKNIKEDEMDMKTILEQNPEAKAEYQAKLESVAVAAVESARDEALDLLEVAGVALTDDLKDALKSGKDAGEFAKTQLASLRASLKTDDSDFGTFKAKDTREEVPAETKEAKEKAAWDKAAADYLAKTKGDK